MDGRSVKKVRPVHMGIPYIHSGAGWVDRGSPKGAFPFPVVFGRGGSKGGICDPSR